MVRKEGVYTLSPAYKTVGALDHHLVEVKRLLALSGILRGGQRGIRFPQIPSVMN